MLTSLSDALHLQAGPAVGVMMLSAAMRAAGPEIVIRPTSSRSRVEKRIIFKSRN
jgi:hypothetical protein